MLKGHNLVGSPKKVSRVHILRTSNKKADNISIISFFYLTLTQLKSRYASCFSTSISQIIRAHASIL